jgi:osmoprotectant transport system permease protein
MTGLEAHAPTLAVAAGKCAPGLPAGFCHHHAETGCVAGNGLFCFGWAADNIDRYVSPFFRHLEIVGISVVAGFVIAMALAVLSHRYRALAPPLLGVTGVLYTVPSVAFFFLLLPLTGFGLTTAVIPLTAYTLQIIYRNTLAGFANVPPDAKDAGRGMGMSAQQLLWRVEMPLATPEIIAGLRIATVSTVAITTLAFLAGAGGLGQVLSEQSQFKTNIIMVAALAIGMALVLDLMLVLIQRLITPWRKARTW